MTNGDDQHEGSRKPFPWIALLIGGLIVGLFLIIVGFILWQLSHPPKEREFFPSSQPEQEARRSFSI